MVVKNATVLVIHAIYTQQQSFAPQFNLRDCPSAEMLSELPRRAGKLVPNYHQHRAHQNISFIPLSCLRSEVHRLPLRPVSPDTSREASLGTSLSLLAHHKNWSHISQHRSRSRALQRVEHSSCHVLIITITTNGQHNMLTGGCPITSARKAATMTDSKQELKSLCRRPDTSHENYRSTRVPDLSTESAPCLPHSGDDIHEASEGTAVGRKKKRPRTCANLVCISV